MIMRSCSFFLLLTTLLFAPLAFGSVETWSLGTVEALSFLTAIFYLLHIRRHDLAALRVPGLLPLLLFLLLISLQLIPLPPDVVKVIAPAVHRAYEPVLELNNSSSWIPLTVNTRATLLEGIRLSSYAAFYILTVQLLSDSQYLTKTIRVVAWLAIGIAFLAIIQKFTSPRAIYWFRPTPENSGTVGPWIYHNHYAGFMELVFPLVLGLFFHYRPTIRYQQSTRSQIASLFNAPGSNLHFFLGFGVVLVLASVFVALSRGGIIAISVGLVLFLSLMARKRAASGNILPFVLIAASLLAVTWMGWDPVLAKFNRTLNETGGIQDGRLVIWTDSAKIIRDFLFTGSGLGTFLHVYPQYSTFPSSAIVDHAHNDYIELLTDGGLAGFALAGWFVLSILTHGFRLLGTRRDPYSTLMIIAGLTAIISLLLHSFTDFNMQNGANGLYFFFLCGLLVSAGNTRLQYRTRPTLLPQVSHNWKWMGLMALPLLFLTVSVQSGILLASRQYKKTASVYLNPQLSTELQKQLLSAIDEAIKFDPFNASYHFYRGNLLFDMKEKELSLASYLYAAGQDPLEGAYLQRIALFFSSTNTDKAAKLMGIGHQRSLNKKELVFIRAEWLYRMNRKEEALQAFHEGFIAFPHLARKIFPLLTVLSFDKDEIEKILPPRPSVWIEFGKFKEELGQEEEVEYYRLRALDFIDQVKEIYPSYFMQLYTFYQKHKRYDDAIAIVRRGVERLPNHAHFHVILGDYYKQQDIPYRAKEEYEQAKILDPGNASIDKKLKSL